MKRMFWTVAAAIIAVGAAMGATSSTASATTVTFDFTKSGGQSTGNAFGNTFTYTSGGLSVTAKGYSLDNTNASTTFQSAAMGYYAGYGLGVCNQNEGLNCSSPNHQIDNNVRYDFVLFQFSPSIQIASAVLQTYSSAGTDATYYIGNTANPLALSGKTFGSLSALGFGARSDDTNGTSGANGTNTVIAGGLTFDSLLLAAQLGGSDDAFKVKSLTITYGAATVPEPATLALLGSGMIGLAAMRRRRA